MLMGAVVNMRPELFHAVVAQVPLLTRCHLSRSGFASNRW